MEDQRCHKEQACNALSIKSVIGGDWISPRRRDSSPRPTFCAARIRDAAWNTSSIGIHLSKVIGL